MQGYIIQDANKKSKMVQWRLPRKDIDAILFAEELKAGITKVNSHYHIGPTTIKKIWKSSNPYEHANSIEWNWHGQIDKPETFSDITSPEIVLPEKTNDQIKDSKLDPIEEKRKRKQVEMERIAKKYF